MQQVYDRTELIAALKSIQDEYEAREQAANELLGLEISNAQKLFKLQVDQLKMYEQQKLESEHRVNESLIKMGFDSKLVLEKDLSKKIKALETQRTIELRTARTKAEIKAIKNKYNQELKEMKKLLKMRKTIEKKDKEELSKQFDGYYKSVSSAVFGGLFNWFGSRDKLKGELWATTHKPGDRKNKEGRHDANIIALTSATKALGNIAVQLKSQVQEVGSLRSLIDTRLQGSNNKRNMFGSIWEQMSGNITSRVGMSALIKQEDVVNNLKTLVGRGIAFNVEQRAFLDTISDKIANTFEATDATLVKLVRIQQADTTAARLGMESALTAFLNNMYETTEYMTEAASSIRASLYEASALMGATEATAFEYQVQKWMGSLYSVGFSNTEGLAGALGKLAAGDISAINDGGYGNLLLMAANRANLSVAEILADGLDDSETNKLMQAMVEYLGDIYAETKNSKVVAQQFANVYGLTASDLKAAANLYGSTKTISKNNMDYGGMMGRLQEMANSMWTRTSTGEMMSNLFENFKYTTAASIGNNPILYAIYSLGTMLKDTVGGIDISLPLYMGTGMNSKLNIADAMLGSSLGIGFLSGMGQMLGGLFTGNGSTAKGMLHGYGIDSSMITTLSRGNGTGLGGQSGMTISESTLISNGSGGDIQQKTQQDAEDEGNKKVEAAGDESKETKLSTVDEHVVNIYNLLKDVVSGTSSFKVDMGDINAWRDVMGGDHY